MYTYHTYDNTNNDKIMKSYLKIKCTRISYELVCLLTFYDYDTYA